jgi:hypothetical protein
MKSLKLKPLQLPIFEGKHVLQKIMMLCLFNLLMSLSIPHLYGQNVTLINDDFNNLTGWNDVYLQGNSGGSKSLSSGNLRLSCGASTQYGVYHKTALTGNFYAELNFDIDDAVGLALIKNNGGVPDLNNYTMLAVTNRNGKVYINQYDKQNGVSDVHDPTNVIPDARYQVLLDGNTWSAPYVGTNKKIRIVHEALSNSFRYYFGTTLTRDGTTSNDWMELAPMYNWMPNSQEVFVALVVRNENGSGTKIVNYNAIKVVRTPEDDQDDSNTGFKAVKREFNWSGFNGNATVVTFGNDFAFDKNIKLVFWDRANNAPMWRLNNQTMHSWQFGERKNGGFEGCGEAMSDRQMHGQEVEIVEDNDVRKVIRWKNVPYFPSYHYPGEGAGTQMPYYEEYWTIYPDGIGTRRFLDCPKLDGNALGVWPEFLEGMTIEGTTAEAGDACASPALSILDMGTTTRNYHPGNWDPNTLNSKQLLFDAHFKNGIPDLFLAYNNDTQYPTNDGYPIEEAYYGGAISWHSPYLKFVHWPVGREPYGQNTDDWPTKSLGLTRNEVTSNALGSFGRYNLGQDWNANYKTNADGRKYRDYTMLIGIHPQNDYDSYRDYVQGWLNPGTVTMLDGNSVFNKNNHDQRELVFTNNNNSLQCNFNFTPGNRWIRNISFRINNWNQCATISVKVNGVDAVFKSAIINNNSLLVWVKTTVTATTKFEISALQNCTGSAKPYSGIAVNIPGKVEAENYDLGGEGVAYHDLNVGNKHGKYRTNDVDIEYATDIDAGYNVGDIQAGEWLAYSINVTQNAKYDFLFRVASQSSGKKFHVEIDGVDVTGLITVPNTGGWQTWQNVVVPNISMTKGAKLMKIVMDNDLFNLNYIDISLIKSPQPYTGTAVAVPGIIQAENYDLGGEGIAFHDLGAINVHGQYRTTEGVDIENCTDAGTGYNVGDLQIGEWMLYTVNVTQGGNYDFLFRVASTATGKTFHVEVDDVNVTGAVQVPNTGGWQTWETVAINNVSLTAGIKVMKVVMDSDLFNLNYIQINAPVITGIVNDDSNQIHIYPNPVNNTLHTRLKNNQLHSLVLYNAVGQKMYTNEEAYQHELNVSSLPQGIYILEIHVDGQRFVQKFMVE